MAKTPGLKPIKLPNLSKGLKPLKSDFPIKLKAPKRPKMAFPKIKFDEF